MDAFSTTNPQELYDVLAAANVASGDISDDTGITFLFNAFTVQYGGLMTAKRSYAAFSDAGVAPDKSDEPGGGTAYAAWYAAL